MGQLIQILIWIVLFAVVAFGLSWTCDKFGLPQPVKWICGVILLIIILVFLAGQLGGGNSFNFIPLRH